MEENAARENIPHVDVGESLIFWEPAEEEEKSIQWHREWSVGINAGFGVRHSQRETKDWVRKSCPQTCTPRILVSLLSLWPSPSPQFLLWTCVLLPVGSNVIILGLCPTYTSLGPSSPLPGLQLTPNELMFPKPASLVQTRALITCFSRNILTRFLTSLVPEIQLLWIQTQIFCSPSPQCNPSILILGGTQPGSRWENKPHLET